MNIEKANNHYKKALDINLRTLITKDCWDSLLDIVQIRNTLVHNNGMIDRKFKNSKTFSRISKLINGDLIFLDRGTINKYLKFVLEVLSAITKLFNTQYQKQLHSLISNYHFNSQSKRVSTDRWISLKESIIETRER